MVMAPIGDNTNSCHCNCCQFRGLHATYLLLTCQPISRQPISADFICSVRLNSKTRSSLAESSATCGLGRSAKHSPHMRTTIPPATTRLSKAFQSCRHVTGRNTWLGISHFPFAPCMWAGNWTYGLIRALFLRRIPLKRAGWARTVVINILARTAALLVRRLNVLSLAVVVKMLFVVALVALAGFASAAPMRKVGGDPCTWGPSYWCANVTQAIHCKTVDYCVSKVRPCFDSEVACALESEIEGWRKLEENCTGEVREWVRLGWWAKPNVFKLGERNAWVGIGSCIRARTGTVTA